VAYPVEDWEIKPNYCMCIISDCLQHDTASISML